MSYDYQTQRAKVFTEDGQKLFLAIRDQAKDMLAKSGAVTSGKLMAHSGDTWDMLACMDRLLELGELLEVPNPHSRAGQHRIFISSNL